jgi:hypothetical protein
VGLAVARAAATVAVTAAVAAGCGGDAPLADGRWYGKAVAVDVAERRLTFAPACKFDRSRWVDVDDRSRVDIEIALGAELGIYFRPGGNAAAGHGQQADLAQLEDWLEGGPGPSSPPGWFVVVRDGAAVSVEQSSGIRSSGRADRRTFACIWSERTDMFVGP